MKPPGDFWGRESRGVRKPEGAVKSWQASCADTIVNRKPPHVRRARLALVLVLIVIAAGVAWVMYSLPAGTWNAWVSSLSPVTLLVALTVLPIFGFPISVLHIAAGARFGLLLGTAAVAGSTLIHLLATFALARLMDEPLRRLLALFGWHLPQVPTRMAWSFGFWVALLPGVSYALKNAVPPLASISLRTFVFTALPTHVATALIGLGIGQATIEFSWYLVAGVAFYALVLSLVTRRLARQLRSHAVHDHASAPITASPATVHTSAAGDLR